MGASATVVGFVVCLAGTTFEAIADGASCGLNLLITPLPIVAVQWALLLYTRGSMEVCLALRQYWLNEKKGTNSVMITCATPYSRQDRPQGR